MQPFTIVAENTADLDEDFAAKEDIGILYLGYSIDGEDYLTSEQLPAEEFYARVRNGSMPTTSQVNPEQALELLGNLAKKDPNILVISFSSKLSGTYQSISMAAAELNNENPDYNIKIVDTKAAASGQGMLVWYAAKLRASGASMEEVCQWVEDNKLKCNHLVAVEDLNHLHRGGRVSKSSAVIGTLIGIKPILRMDDEGGLEVISKVRGRKKSLAFLVDLMKESKSNALGEETVCMIGHGDCLEDAREVAKMVEEQMGIQVMYIHHLCATVGAHAGPGTIGLFFMGDKRITVK